MLLEMSFQRGGMVAKLTLRTIKLDCFQTVNTTVLIKLKIISEGIITNPNQFGNLRMWKIVAFQPQCFHPALYQWNRMAIPLVVENCNDFRCEL